MRIHALVSAVLVAFLGSACGREPGPLPTAAIPHSGRLAWNAVNCFAYQLQDVHLERLRDSGFQLLVIDPSRDGSETGRFTRAELDRLRGGPGGATLVLAYVSIGEAEDYRGYWRPKWDADRDGNPDPGAPTWLGPVNPDWAGNYRVRYWDPDWQRLIFDALDRVIAAGFDGVYLDIVDGFEYWGSGTGERAAVDAERTMVSFVAALAARARERSGNPDFGIFPQNGETLGKYPEYLATVSGLGREDVWYDGDTENPPAEAATVVADLRRFRAAGKPVLVIDYPTRPELQREFHRRARAAGFVPYAAPRALDRLVVIPGLQP